MHIPRPDPIDGLISHLSHDLKAPVRAIAEIASWIEEELEQSEATHSGDIKSHLSLLISRSDRLQTMITDLTTYARVGSLQEPFTGNWGALIGRVRAKTPALANFQFSCQLDAIPAVTQNDLDMLLCALLSNATKHHDIENGHISLSVLRSRDECCVTVSDDGPGIPPDQREKALQMLTTLQRRDIVEGSGLGFSIIKRIADHYGGTFDLGSAQNGQGCAVSVGLPRNS